MFCTIENDELRVKISTTGAELKSVYGKKTGCEYMWQGNPEYWDGTSPNLFPICGRVTGGKYIYEGKEYSLAAHGFLQSSELEIAGFGPDFLSLRLTSNEATRACYPFEFIYRITYKLSGPVLKASICVENTGEGGMYFAIGAHPGFNLPLEDGLKFEDYSITLDPDIPCEGGRKLPEIEITADGYVGPNVLDFPLDGSSIPLRHELFAVEGRFFRKAGHTAVLSAAGGKRSVSMTFPFAGVLGLWHAAASDAPYVCIEPWSGSPDRQDISCELSEKEDMNFLAAGEKYSTGYTVEFR